MKTSTLLLLGGIGAVVLYAMSKREDMGEGGDTTEPVQCPPGQEWNEAAGMCVPAPPREAQFDPGPGLQPPAPPRRIGEYSPG